jgi:hypothetical protein
MPAAQMSGTAMKLRAMVIASLPPSPLIALNLENDVLVVRP